jgi:hypothetical protein
MLRRALVLALTFGLVPAAGPVLAQDGLGEPLTFVDADGITRGTVTVSEIADPFQEFDPGRPPEEGMKYVLLTVQFEAAADQQFDAEPWMIVLQGADGTLWTYNSVPRPEGQIVPDLQGQTLAPGNRISGVIGYVVPADAQLDQVLFTPTSSRLATLVDVTPGPGPAPGEAVNYTDATGSSVAITAQVEDPYTGYDPGSPPEEGSRLAVVSASYEDVGELPYWADPYDLTVRDADGNVYSRVSLYREPGFAIPEMESQTLAPGDHISGLNAYQVPEGATLAGVYYQVESNRIVQVADLTGGGPVEPGPTAAPVATPSPPPAATPAPPASPAPSASAGTGR